MLSGRARSLGQQNVKRAERFGGIIWVNPVREDIQEGESLSLFCFGFDDLSRAMIQSLHKYHATDATRRMPCVDSLSFKIPTAAVATAGKDGAGFPPYNLALPGKK